MVGGGEVKEHVIDRTSWTSGPWDSEPDRIQWKTAAGLPGLIVRNYSGALCGYAAVPPGHPLHGADYDDARVDVHGGLTYADACREDGPICHVPEPGEPDDVWWFGFDCNHYQDLAPGLDATLRKVGHEPTRIGGEVYRTIDYVTAEVESLARQLVEVTR